MKDDHKHHKEDHKKDQSPDNGKVPFPEKQAEKKEGGELEKCRQEAADYKDKYLRALAELNNTHKRASKEKEDFAKYAASGVVNRLLPILDNFDMAVKAVPEGMDRNFVSGIEMIKNNLFETLKREGLEKIISAGQKFDPLKHEVVGTLETEDDKLDGIIAEELRTGYSFKGITLRPAMVRISKKKHEEPDGEPHAPSGETAENAAEGSQEDGAEPK